MFAAACGVRHPSDRAPTVVRVVAFDQVPAGDWERLARVLDAGIDDLSAEQQALAVGRASRRLGVADLEAQDDQHLQILWDELRAAVLGASLERLVKSGELEVAGVAECGHLLYGRATGKDPSQNALHPFGGDASG